MKHIDFDEILTEWSYKLPKGFPTIVDGKFVDRREVILLNDLLEQRGLNQIPLPEARVYAHPESSYIPNDRYAQSFQDIGFETSELESNPFKHTTTLDPGKNYTLVKGSSALKNIDYDAAAELVKRKDTVAVQSDSYSDNYLIVAGDVSQLTAKKDDSAAETVVKEGMVVLFYYSNIQEQPTEENIIGVIQELNKVINKVPDYAIDDLSKTKLAKFLTKVQSLKPKKLASALTDYWSIASLMKKGGYNSNKFICIRTGLFDTIRSIASSLTQLYADKWCPGDIYLVDKSKYAAIQETVSSIQKNMPEDGIGIINSLFVDEWGKTGNRPNEGIVAVSLKEEKAQGGKAKQFLQTLSREDVTYNVDKTEFDLPASEIGKKIIYYREAIQKLADTAEVDVTLVQDKDVSGMDEKRLREKFASLKLTYFLLGEKGADVDDNLLGAVAFGLSLSGVNPTFWKIVGSRTGEATISKFKAASTISLMDFGLGHERSKIKIVDTNSNNSVKFEMDILKTDQRYSITLNARSNGGKQATLEIVNISKS